MAQTPVAFWGLILNTNEIHRISVTEDFCVKNIAFGDDVKGDARTVVKVHYFAEVDSEDEEAADKANEDGEVQKEYVLCSLIPGKSEQFACNLQFSEEEEVGFSISGPNPVHLVGNYVAPPDFFDQPPGSDDEYGSEEDDEEMDSEFDDDEIMMDGDSDEEDEDDDRFEELPTDAAASTATKNGKKRAAADLEDGAQDVTDAELAAAAAAEGLDMSKLSKNQRKRLNKKLRADDGEAVAPAADGAAAKAKVAVSKEKVQAVAKDAKDGKVKKQTAEKETVSKDGQQVAQKVKLPSGVVVEDKKVGTGPAAKSGSRIGMRYVGKLSNGKIFDSNTKGKPLTFRLGKGEVIKGWDQGCIGLRIGGERRLTIPPEQAYGRQKLPGIPANSTLIFDVKLVELK